MNVVFKRATSMLLMSVLIFTLAACSGNKEQPAASPASNGNKDAGQASQEPVKKVKLTFQNAYPDETNVQHRVMKKLVEDYKAANPGVEIEVDSLNIDQQKIKLKTQAASDSMPDITVVNASAQMEPFVKGGKLAPLNDILDRDGLGDTFQGGILDYYTFDDQVYALPDGNNVAAIFYNKKLFEEAGVAVPTTFDELLAAVNTFKDKGIVPMTIGEKETWTGSYLFMNIALRLAGPGYLKEVMSGGKSFTDPAFVESIAKMQELIQAGGFQEGATSYNYNMASNLFTTGQAEIGRAHV